ncbi:MAG: sigma-70 family RNA polymerase sigma factor [Ginsengibacter sp.]
MQNRSVFDTAAERPVKQTLQPEKWVELYADYLYTYALGRLNDKELARDLVQDTFLSALEKTDGFRGESTERTWLTAIIKYKVIDIYRKRSGSFATRDKFSLAADDEEYFDPDLNNWKKEHWPAPFGVEDSDPLHNKEFMSVLQKCVQKLPPLWLSVFRLKHLEDEGTEDICKELRITSSNFWVIVHRAKVNLRSCLQKNWI